MRAQQYDEHVADYQDYLQMRQDEKQDTCCICEKEKPVKWDLYCNECYEKHIKGVYS